MARFLLAGVVCFAIVSSAVAAEPAARGESNQTGRDRIEAILQSPAHLDFGHQTTTSIGQLLYWLRTEDGLSIRYDIPALATMYGLDPTGGAGPSVAIHKVPKGLIAALIPPRNNLALELAKPLPKPMIAGSVRQSVNYAPPQAAPENVIPAPEVEERIPSDADLAAEIKNRISAAQLQHYDIGVKVSGGICYLSGTVPDIKQGSKALEIAGGVHGLTKVVSELKVAAADAPPAAQQQINSDKKSIGPQVGPVASHPAAQRREAPLFYESEDQGLAADIERRLASGRLEHYRIDAALSEGTCLLTGFVGNDAQLQAARKIVAETKGVKTIIDHLKIADPNVSVHSQLGNAIASDEGVSLLSESGGQHVDSSPLFRNKAGNYRQDAAAAATADSLTAPTSTQTPQTKIINVPPGPRYYDALARKIKEQLRESNLQHYDINIQVFDGTCFLTGSVCDQAQMDNVCDIVRHTDGIKSIESHLKIVAAHVALSDPNAGFANASDKLEPTGTPIIGSTREWFAAEAAAVAPPRQIVLTGAQQPLPQAVMQPVQQTTAVAHAPAKSADSIQGFLKQANRIEVPVEFVDGQHISVATALRLALDAIPGAEDDSSMLMPLTDAMRLDFIVEDDGIVITTRLKALTTKETRVYSLKHLSKMDPQELSKVICQSVRPWSWRSRIDELGEQLKNGALSLPPAALQPIAQSALEITAEATGLDISASSSEKKPAASDDAQQAAMVGKAVAGGLVTLAQASLSAAEVVHYADPPTGSIRVLSGKLVITQSQAAHREITALLKQLSDE